MDFASLMKSQIATSSKSNEDGGKKYLRRSEIEAQREAQYRREQEDAEKARLERLGKKRKREEEEAERGRVREERKMRLAEESRRIQAEEEEAEERVQRKRLGLPELEKKVEGTDKSSLKQDEHDIPEHELLFKLKEMGEPRFMFDETHAERLRRYRTLIEKAIAPKLRDGPIPTSLELVPEAEMKVPDSVPRESKERLLLLRQIGSYFDMLLSEWQLALARRSKEVRESSTGKQAFNAFAAARDNLRPLFKKLETNDIADSLLAAILEIVHLAQLKQYVKANDAYLRLSIGKAAWPIGVTMVGIHERSAREKLHETENQAHILSDETTRKMLQGIKRCLSFAQTRWPPDDIGQLMG